MVPLFGPMPHALPTASPPPLRRKLTKDVRGYIQKCVDKGKEINLTSSINKETITRGLRCVAARGGWCGRRGNGEWAWESGHGAG